MTRWRHLTRDEMGGYDFEMYEKEAGERWVSLAYDFGVWIHPRGEEASMENIDEFVSEYPAGYYWNGHDRSQPLGVGSAQSGPFDSRDRAKAEADAWLAGAH